ncbi:MAG: DUF1365 domain-containing protein [Gammaproteobacteria bacterium]|nr:DUF1365 domain-containing protein [Gammaproteobacteria bacterium]
MGHQVYRGWVRHRRYAPREHAFKYRFFMPSVDLDDVHSAECWPLFSTKHPAMMRLKPKHYLDGDLSPDAAWQKVVDLGGQNHGGKVVWMGQPSCFGLYFSPVNFYYCHDADGALRYVIAEVSNTPWNERHHYLIDAERREDTPKAFHVSPFMQMNQHYHWVFSALEPKLLMHIENHTESGKLFDATMVMHAEPWGAKYLLKNLLRIPVLTLHTVIGIYWQALKIWLKGIPYQPKPTESGHAN